MTSDFDGFCMCVGGWGARFAGSGKSEQGEVATIVT